MLIDVKSRVLMKIYITCLIDKKILLFSTSRVCRITFVFMLQLFDAYMYIITCMCLCCIWFHIKQILSSFKALFANIRILKPMKLFLFWNDCDDYVRDGSYH